jgi:A/G-specific adenine glycosylase
MHRAAQIVVSDFDGEFPSSVEALETLPGIGRSTAGAIVTLGHGGWAPILDGNVKRVLARFHAIEGWPGKADVLTALWAASESHTPRTRTGEYTQGIMDLGATLCTKSNPGCLYCPMSDDCQARIENRPADFPGKKPKKAVPVRSTVFLQCLDREGRVLLERRPPTGIWGGLWSFPEVEEKAEVANWLSNHGLRPTGDGTEQPHHSHTFSHFKLDITPIMCHVKTASSRISERDDHRWFTIAEALALGLPAPVLKMLNTLTAKD